MTQKGVLRFGVAAAAIVLLAAAPSFAQTTGRIEGRVLDSSGAVLPGASMTASSPNLQGARITTSENDGRFRFLALPPGTYTVKSEMAGFSTVEQPNVRVQLDSTVTLELTMSPAAITEAVTVTDAAPVIDVTSTTTGAKFDNQLFDRLPTARNYQALALAAPSVTTGGLGTNNPSVGGASAAENRYVVDGLDTTDPAFGTSNVSLPMEFIQEVEVKTGGYQAEYSGALGGVLNVLTKSGSNQLRGDVFGYYTDDSLRNTSPRTETVGQDLGIQRQFDVGFDVGGKLIEDKLWFFAAANPTFTDRAAENLARLQYTTERRNVLFSGKLTWQADPNHQLVASVFGDPGKADNLVFTNSTVGLSLQNNEASTYNYSLNYNGILSSGLFLKVAAGRSDQNEKEFPIVDVPRYTDQAQGAFIRQFASGPECGDLSFLPRNGIAFNPGCVGGGFVQENGDRSRDELSAALSFFTKTGGVNHEFKLGTGLRRVKYRDHAHYPAPVPGALLDETGAVVDSVGITGQRYNLFADSYSLIEYDQNSSGETDELGVFIQDQMKFGNRVTLNLGLRFDSSHSQGDTSIEGDRELDFGLGDMIAPRIGLVVDVTGDGRSKLFGHWGRFYESIPLDINVRAFGREQFNFYYFYYPSNGSLPSGSNQGTFYYVYQAGGGGVKVQEGIEAMYSDEIVGGFEYEVVKNLSLGVKGVYRTLGQVIEDISVDNAHTYFIANVGEETTYTSNPVTDEPLAAPIVFPAAERTYKALEFTVNKAFASNWQWNASYVLSKNEGNFGGLFRQDNGQLDPNITSLFDLPSLLRGAFGNLPNDRTHQFKTYGTYRFPFNVTTGLFAEYLSGTPISKLGSHQLYGRRERFIGDRGAFGRTPNTWHIDLHLEYPIKLGDRSELRLIADGFNITNQAEPATVDQEWTLRRAPETTDNNECGGAAADCPSANRVYGLATSFQDPRAVRFGVKLSW